MGCIQNPLDNECTWQPEILSSTDYAHLASKQHTEPPVGQSRTATCTETELHAYHTGEHSRVLFPLLTTKQMSLYSDNTSYKSKKDNQI